CRNLSCVGAEPIALTDCLNFGNPERLEVYYQLEECIKGMAAACRVLGVPVVSGNVSLYNETRGQAVYPTPVVGALGLLDEVTRHCTLGFKQEGDLVLLLGASGLEGDPAHLAGSEYLELLHGRVAGQPRIDLELERRVQALCRRAIRQGLLHSAHDCSDGGLAVALAECSIVGELGFRGTFSTAGRWDVTLFGEAPSRVVVSLTPEEVSQLKALAGELQVPLMELGVVQREHFQLPGLLDLPLAELAEAWHHGLERALQ
ncbi:MAG: AIR synthase-related protein, partial [Dehalococcoidia bacterium]